MSQDQQALSLADAPRYIRDLVILSAPPGPHINVITIEGRAGSGKTTLATALSAQLHNCPVVHMDDLYDGWTQDLITDLPLVLQSQILEPLRNGLLVEHRLYDWDAEQFAQKALLPPHEFLILEGVGAGHPDIAAQVALSVWVETDVNVLLERLVARDGEGMRNHLVHWQQHEAQYFAACDPRSVAAVEVAGD